MTMNAPLTSHSTWNSRFWLSALDALPEPMVITDLEGQLRFVNAAFTRFNGYALAEVEGHNPRFLKSGLTDPSVYAALWAHLAQGQPFTGRVVNRKKNGDHYQAELTVVPLTDDAGAVTHYLSTHRDLTPLLASQEALLRSEASLRALIEGLAESIVVHRDGSLVFVNPCVLTLLGYRSPDALLGKPLRDLIHPDDRDAEQAREATLSEDGTSTGNFELRLVRKDGSGVTVEASAQRLVFNDLPSIVFQARDLTAQKNLAAQLMQIDRMIAMGTLAAGVGHEIKNPLAYVMANLDFVAAELPTLCNPEGCPQLAEVEAALREARSGAERVRDVVRDLNTFSRSDSDRREPVALQRVIDSAANMAFAEIRPRARLVKDFAEVPPVLANESRLGQVFLNLLINAAHAIPAGDSAQNEIRVSLRAGEGMAIATVTDTGMGIPPDVLPKIFDPFFTTKPVGQGTGLGLSICHGIVHAAGGKIEVTSELGKGTTFTLRFPAAVAAPAPVLSRGKVLIVDDDPLVGAALARSLSREHDVEVVHDGRAALTRIEAGGRYDVIYCDLQMPEMGGLELYAQVARHWPQSLAKLVFLTGGSFTDEARAFLAGIPNLQLEKPFDPQQLRSLTRARVGPAGG